MAKKIVKEIKLQIPGGQANPAPPVGPALGQHGVNIMEFCKAFNAKTSDRQGLVIPGDHHSLLRPFLHVRAQNAARLGVAAQGHGRRQRLG